MTMTAAAVRWDLFSVDNHRRSLVSLDEVRLLKEVCKEFNITTQSIKRQKRDRIFSDARMVYAFLGRTHLGLKLERIAAMLHIDHSSVAHKLKSMKAFIDVNDPVVMKMKRIESKLFKHN